MTEPAATAPSYDPGAVGLPWWRRALAQGAGYIAPSALFAFVPWLFPDGYSVLTWVLMVALTVVLLVFFLGSTLVAHWSESRRWLWVLGLILSIVAIGVVTDGGSRPYYFAAYITAVLATLIPWKQARIAILGVSFAAAGLALYYNDLFGVVITLMGFAIGWAMGSGIESDRVARALQQAEERTAVLAVAAERERIGRDLHDILGHSLTTIAVKADLAGRLVGRSDEAARAEIDEVATVARQALSDVRATASGMREVRLVSEVAAARSVLAAAGVECRAPSALPVLDDERSEVLGYVVREAITNVVRHAGATVCTIEVDGGVTVRDDGRGFATGRARTGLRGLANRVEEAGGVLHVESGRDGTAVRAEFDDATFGDPRAGRAMAYPGASSYPGASGHATARSGASGRTLSRHDADDLSSPDRTPTTAVRGDRSSASATTPATREPGDSATSVTPDGSPGEAGR